jgi:sigma-54 dependent transcriptional regulator, acetoin dehydrogenase operon transcriptional activator AcoR
MEQEQGMHSDVARPRSGALTLRDAMAVVERCEPEGSAPAKRLALDVAGNVVAASEEVRKLLGSPPHPVARAPRPRPGSGLAQLQDLAARFSEKADDDQRGCIVLGPPLAETTETYLVTPVTGPLGLVGWILSSRGRTSPSGSADDAASPDAGCGVDRVPALAEDSVLLLEPNEIRFAEADRHFIWLTTDYGRLRAATKGMHNLERELARHGFVRVHRSFLINPERVRRVNHRGHGMITLSTDHWRVETIPVSRRYTHDVRRLFGL